MLSGWKIGAKMWYQTRYKKCSAAISWGQTWYPDMQESFRMRGLWALSHTWVSQKIPIVLLIQYKGFVDTLLEFYLCSLLRDAHILFQLAGESGWAGLYSGGTWPRCSECWGVRLTFPSTSFILIKNSLHFFKFSITVDIQYYISFMYTAQWLDIYIIYEVVSQ